MLIYFPTWHGLVCAISIIFLIIPAILAIETSSSSHLTLPKVSPGPSIVNETWIGSGFDNSTINFNSNLTVTEEEKIICERGPRYPNVPIRDYYLSLERILLDRNSMDLTTYDKPGYEWVTGGATFRLSRLELGAWDQFRPIQVARAAAQIFHTCLTKDKNGKGGSMRIGFKKVYVVKVLATNAPPGGSNGDTGLDTANLDAGIGRAASSHEPETF